MIWYQRLYFESFGILWEKCCVNANFLDIVLCHLMILLILPDYCQEKKYKRAKLEIDLTSVHFGVLVNGMVSVSSRMSVLFNNQKSQWKTSNR